MLADWLTASGLGSLKPVLAALVLPPAPFIALALVGAGFAGRRPWLARSLVVLACVGLWLSGCAGAARWVETHGLDEPAPLAASQRAQLRARAAAGEPVAIVALGSGMNGFSPEYGAFDLTAASLARIRYAAWLGRQTGLPVAASGGVGWASLDAPAEASRMAEIAQAEWGVTLRWTETRSRDTHENAVDTVAMLRAAGIREIVLVTHGLHMPRALREFRQAASAGPLLIVPAPIGQAWPPMPAMLEWLPSAEGALRMREVSRELLAAVADRRT